MSRTGVANLLCKFCFRRFTQPIWLQNHIEKKHPEGWSQRRKSKKRAADESEQDEDHQAKYMRSSSRTFLPNSGSPSYEADDDDGIQPANKPANKPADEPEATATVRVYPDAGLPCAYVPRSDECARTDGDPYYPFASEEEFNFAEMVIVEKFSAKSIDRMLKDSVGVKDEIKASLKSNYCLRQKVDRMEDGLGASSWRKSHLENIVWNAQHAKEPIKFWHRDIIECAKWLLQQPAYEKHLSYAPQKRFEAEGRRVYGEMHTADWWWERQSSLNGGDTVVPIIFLSDATHLTNFSGDKKAWPVYMTIGNLSTTVRMAPSQHAILLIALLPIPIKLRDVPISRYTAQKEHNRTIQQHILRHVLEPLIDANRRVFDARCADGYFRHCVASPAAWIADYPEHRDLHNVKNGICYWCECPYEQMGEFPVKPHERRIHTLYRMLSETNTPTAKARLTHHGVHQGSNVLWDLDCVVSDLPKPDLLHTMQLGMLKHLLGWLQDFLKQHNRLEEFNNIWLSVPPYLDMPQPQKAYGEVSSWQGKEIKVMSRFLVGVLRCALRTAAPSQRGVFDDAIECCRTLVEFYFYAQYESHDGETLALMDDALKHFHTSKRVFRQFRVTKKVAHQGKEYRKTLMEERDAALQGKSVAQQEKLRKEWQSFISVEMVEHNEEGSDFNFPKIHQMLHFGEQIRRYGSLKQWSTETGESSHRTQLKVPYNKSNRTGDIYGQMIENYLRSDAFAIRRLNIAARRGENTVSSSGTIGDSLAGVKFTSDQSSSEQAKIISFATLLASVRDDNLRNKLHHATNRFLLSRKIKIASDNLLQCAVNVYHGMRVPLTDMYGEKMIQYVRCTGEKSWYGQPARHDWVWVKASKQREDQEPPYGALRGRLPYRLLKLFKLAADGGPFWCAFVQTTTPAAGGTPERASRMVKVTKYTTGSGYAVISGDTISGAAHLIPEEPDCSEIQNKAWMVNSHIDLATWNEVY